MATALYDRESQFEERLADTQDVTHHHQETSMPNFNPISHLSSTERALLASLTARHQVERRSVDSSSTQLPAPEPEQQRRPSQTSTQGRRTFRAD
jgi:hypothetical protein